MGLVVFGCSNAGPLMPAWGGTEPRFGTNPLGFAAPRAGSEQPLVFDMATSTTARERFPDVPLSLSDALHRGMAKDPKDRYASIDEFAAAVLQEDTIERAALPPPKSRSKSKPAEPARDKAKVPARPEARGAAQPAAAKPAGSGKRVGIMAVGADAAISAIAIFMILREGNSAAPTEVAQQPPAASGLTRGSGRSPSA